MIASNYNLIWIKQLGKELKSERIDHMKLVYDNQAVFHIASNPMFHERDVHRYRLSFCLEKTYS